MMHGGILETPRLRLRPLVADDVYDLYAYAATTEFSAHGGFRRLSCFRAAQEAMAGYLHYASMGIMVPWAIELAGDRRSDGHSAERATGTMIGHCLIQNINERRARADLLFGIEPARWGNGYATEAASAALEWTMSRAGIRTVTARCLPGNLRSRRVIAKLGMVTLGMVPARDLGCAVDPGDGEHADRQLEAFVISTDAHASAARHPARSGAEAQSSSI